MNRPSSHTLFQKVLAWGVHLLTASGILAGFMALLAITAHDWHEAMLWLLLGLLIDGIDGTFARLFHTKEVLPYMDGKAIDYVIDFANYALIPAYFLYESGLLPEALRLPATLLVLLVSALYYGKSGMVSQDLYFVGFPVLWNMAAFYLFFGFHAPPWINFAIVISLAVLHFVPIKFLYPSQTPTFRSLNIAVSVLFFLVNAAILWLHPRELPWLQGLSLVVVLYFGAMAVYATWFPRTGGLFH